MKATWCNCPPSRLRQVYAPLLAAGISALAVGFFFVPGLAWLWPVLVLLGGATASVLAMVPGTVRPVEVDLAPTLHGVDVRAGGETVIELRPRELDGASLCQGTSGVDLAVTHEAHPHRSFVFEGLDPAEAEHLRRALGLPHGGMGATVFPQGVVRGYGTAAFGGLCLLLTTFNALFALGAMQDEPNLGFLAFEAILSFAFIAFVWTTLDLSRNADRRTRRCALEPSALVYWSEQSTRTIPYASLDHVSLDRRGLDLRSLSGECVRITLFAASSAERAHLVRQLLSARARGRGTGRAPDVVESVGTLARAPGESLRAWLLRVDAVKVLPHGHANYREMGISEEELWRALGDPDTPPPVRIAIARRLGRRDEPSRVRVAALADRLHEADDRLRARIAVSVDVADVSERATELLSLAKRL